LQQNIKIMTQPGSKQIEDIFIAIKSGGFSNETVAIIDNYINNIQNDTDTFERFTRREQDGLRAGGRTLIWSSVIASYAARSIESSGNASGCTQFSLNIEIDALQEKLIEEYSRIKDVWVEPDDSLIRQSFGSKIAEGAEARVYYSSGESVVVKERASIYSTFQKALDSIVLHNSLFPETSMHVLGFTRDEDGVFRTILTQPYIKCQRLATKDEIDRLVEPLGFRDNWNGQGVNYINDRMKLEDLHPANVFIDIRTGKPTCIDCIAKLL